MFKKPAEKAFTLMELVVVLAVGALLISILLPGLNKAGNRGQGAMCLANLRQIAAGSLAYANEDAREQIVPLHRMMVSTLAATGWGGTEWSWRTAMPSSFGGRTATKPFPTGSGLVTVMMEDPGLWSTSTRPLNDYIYSEGVFHCPADTGYPDSEWVGEAPPVAAGIPCFQMLGNSYRCPNLGLVWVSGSLRVGSFTSGVWGRRASSIVNASETVFYSDPLFYSFARAAACPGPPSDPIPGWHGELLHDNVAYCDGSARLTRVDPITQFTPEQLEQMGYTPNFQWYWFLRRGPTWTMDCYPSLGSIINVWSPDGTWVTPPLYYLGYTGWPFEALLFDGYPQFNPPPGP